MVIFAGLHPLIDFAQSIRKGEFVDTSAKDAELFHRSDYAATTSVGFLDSIFMEIRLETPSSAMVTP